MLNRIKQCSAHMAAATKDIWPHRSDLPPSSVHYLFTKLYQNFKTSYLRAAIMSTGVLNAGHGAIQHTHLQGVAAWKVLLCCQSVLGIRLGKTISARKGLCYIMDH